MGGGPSLPRAVSLSGDVSMEENTQLFLLPVIFTSLRGAGREAAVGNAWNRSVLLPGGGGEVDSNTDKQSGDTLAISLALDWGHLRSGAKSGGFFLLYLSVFSLQPVPPQVMDHPGGPSFPAGQSSPFPPGGKDYLSQQVQAEEVGQ